MAPSSKKLLTRKPLVEELNKAGFPISLSSVNKLCGPAINRGPPIEAWFGKRPLYRLDRGIKWAQSLLSQEPTRVAPPTRRRAAKAAEQTTTA